MSVNTNSSLLAVEGTVDGVCTHLVPVHSQLAEMALLLHLDAA